MLIERIAFVALLALALIFPLELVRAPLRLGPYVSFTNVELGFLITPLLWMAALLVRRRRPNVPRALAIPLGVWIGVLILSTVQAPAYRAEALRFTSRMVGGVLLSWATYDLTRTRARWERVAASIALIGIVVGALGVAEALAWKPATDWLAQFKEAPTRVGEVVRVSATLIYATIASMVLELTAPLALAWASLGAGQGVWRGLSKGALVIGSVVVLVAQALTLTRGGLIALSVAFTILAITAWPRDKSMALAAIGGIGVLVLTSGAFALIKPVVALRFVSETDRAWYRAAYLAPSQITVRAGEKTMVTVRVRNVGLRAWHPDGSYAFALSYHLYREDGTPVAYEGLRTRLPQTITPGEEVVLQAQVIAPPKPGVYRVEWDMVQEAVTWFSWKGTPTATTYLQVRGPAARNTILPPSAPPTDVRLLVPPVGRLTLWKTALRMFQDRPLLGVGPDNFRQMYGHYAGVSRWNTAIHANNLYLEWLADTGVLGFGAFLWFLWALVRRLRRLLSSGYEQPRAEMVWRLGLATALIAWFVHGVFDYFYEFLPTAIPFWLITGLAVRNFQQEAGRYARGI